ncbi:MAG: alkyl sulfatase dimerization domain-containing protein [Candidatus Binatia bacterium]|nr:alkyl sulfatase dimerization domain-containing protein [Candidatus Binatia bacterium]
MTIDGLNTGLRQDEIPDTIELPPELADQHSLREQYVSKMIIRQYIGWWDDIPSHWTPAPMDAQAREIVALAGGAPKLVARARDAMREPGLTPRP